MKELRDYQIDVLDQLQHAFAQRIKEVCVAMCPSSGKTFTTLSFIKQNPDKKFLILTHGQNILKNQWELEIKNVFGTASPDNVVYGLPQGLSKNISKKVDFVIIDEAHEFRFAQDGMVDKIIKDARPAHIISLTGTPSKFILRGIKTICVDASSLIQKGYVSDLYLGLFSTNVDLKQEDYSSKEEFKEVNARGANKLESGTVYGLERLLVEINKRLASSVLTKGSPNAYKGLSWAPALGRLKKTMIACKSIKQAKIVEDFFKKQNIKTISSNYLNDKNTENIRKFQDRDEHGNYKDYGYKILIVVNRGVLGFDMPDLVNVVDMTGSHTIDVIYQLFARVMRKSPTVRDKYFFKLTSDKEMTLTRFFMNAAINLMKHDFITKYNGKNLKNMKIPSMVVKKTAKKALKLKCKIKKVNKIYVDPDFYGDVMANQMLTDIFSKTNSILNEYCYTNSSLILSEITGKKPKIVNISLTDLLFIKKTGKIPERVYGKD